MKLVTCTTRFMKIILIGMVIFIVYHPLIGQNRTLSLPGKVKLDMVWIAPGTFIMGSPATEAGRREDEGPQTTVTFTKGYWLQKTELTIGQWKAVTGESL